MMLRMMWDKRARQIRASLVNRRLLWEYCSHDRRMVKKEATAVPAQTVAYICAFV